MNSLIWSVFCGVGATVLMDMWTLIRRSLFGIAAPDYGLVGRWFAHMVHGQFHHDAIASSPAVAGERLIGWLAHYLIGIAFAALLIVTGGNAWIGQPTLEPALIVGIGTVAAPFLLMQPGMGAGIAASRTPRPCIARMQSLITHAIFGLGLYLSGLAMSFLSRL